MQIKNKEFEKHIDVLLENQERNMVNTLCYLFIHQKEDPKVLIEKYYNNKITEDQLEPLIKNTEENLVNDMWLYSVLKRSKEQIINQFADKDIKKCLK